MTLRQQQKNLLISQKELLEKKYPPVVYNNLNEEPEDILQHVREVVRFGRQFKVKSKAELDEISFNHYRT